MHQPRPSSMRFQVVHTTSYFYSEPVALCHNELHLTPRNTPTQTCLVHLLSIRPPAAKIEEAVDYFGNQVRWFTIGEPHLEFSITARSDVRRTAVAFTATEKTQTWEAVSQAARAANEPSSFEASQFLFDSPSIAACAELAEYAAPSFPAGRPWLEGLLDLTARIHEDFVYDPTATNVSTPLATVMAMRRGVCQDFAHLQIGCLRAMGLPARYVSGYLLTQPPPGQPRLVGADASHAWIAAWCPELGWVEFDPTNDVMPSLEHITVAWGRDYSDVCPIKGVFIGGGRHSMRVSVDVRPVEERRSGT
jgi:transglutaminase-like putative cysteine protease